MAKKKTSKSTQEATMSNDTTEDQQQPTQEQPEGQPVEGTVTDGQESTTPEQTGDQVPEAPAEETSEQGPVTDAAPTAADIVTDAPNADVNVIAQETKVASNVQQPTTQVGININSEFDEMVEDVLANGSSSQKEVARFFKEYCDDLQPGKPVDGGTVGITNQYGLYKTITNVLNNVPIQEFTETWKLLLCFFMQYYSTGALGPRYIFRFGNFWARSTGDYAKFTAIVNLIHATYNPSERANGLKHIDLQTTMKNGFTAEEQKRILMFYQG